MSLLEVEDLRTVFHTQRGTIPAVDGVSFEIEEGETLGIVGESGSGKSVTARSIMGLIQDPGEVVRGSIEYKGRDLLTLEGTERRSMLGDEISMVFQDPEESLNPVFSIGQQITEALRIHGYDEGDPWDRAVELLEAVGIPSPAEHAEKYPHQYSGGMAQRAMIAIAIARDPSLLIADEPTTALDVTVEAQILDLIDELSEDFGMATMFISHDLGVIWEVCDRVAVMYAGNIVEVADTEELFTNPKHPYTRGLLDCLPQNDDVEPIQGEVPPATDRPSGCAFHPRCPHATEACTKADPVLAEDEGREVACYLFGDSTSDGGRVEKELPDAPFVTRGLGADDTARDRDADDAAPPDANGETRASETGDAEPGGDIDVQ